MNYTKTEPPINLERLSDSELLEIVDELQKETFSDNSIARKLAIQFFGGDSLPQILSVGIKVLPIVANRMKEYGLYIESKNHRF